MISSISVTVVMTVSSTFTVVLQRRRSSQVSLHEYSSAGLITDGGGGHTIVSTDVDLVLGHELLHLLLLLHELLVEGLDDVTDVIVGILNLGEDVRDGLLDEDATDETMAATGRLHGGKGHDDEVVLVVLTLKLSDAAHKTALVLTEAVVLVDNLLLSELGGVGRGGRGFGGHIYFKTSLKERWIQFKLMHEHIEQIIDFTTERHKI